MYVYKVWCEWDIGQDDLVFETEELAAKWVKQDWNEDDMDITLEEAYSDGLVSIDFIKLVKEIK